MAFTITLLILIGLSLIALKLVILFKLIDFGFNRWIKPYADPRGGGSRAEMILRERFASGEIDAEEMRRRSEVIAAGRGERAGR